MTLQKGDAAEDFELQDHDGNSVTLSSFKGTKNVVLCFYPKNHLFACPSKKVFEMAKSVISVYPQITGTDSVLFAISVDSVDSQAEFVKQYENLNQTIENAVKLFIKEVTESTYPKKKGRD